MAVDNGFGGRAWSAWKQMESARGDRVGQDELGELVATELGEEAIPQGTVSKWLRGDSVPPLDRIVAFAHVLGVDPGWLAFGDESKAPAPLWAMKGQPTGSGERVSRGE